MTAVEIDDQDVWEIYDPDECLVLVGCSARKLAAPAPARELYTGELFRDSVRWAESWHLRWAVLSAKHGIVQPDTVLAPYDSTWTDRHVQVKAGIPAMRGQLPDDVTHLVVVAGEAYAAVVAATWPELPVWSPLLELPERGYGHYRAWLRRNSCKDVSS